MLKFKILRKIHIYFQQLTELEEYEFLVKNLTTLHVTGELSKGGDSLF